MAQKETVERILDAAEALFAERGFAETSLRTITSAAQVNLAAVNYHFGSKKALIQAVFERFLDPLVVAIDARLDQIEADGEPIDAQLLLTILAETVYAVHGRNANRATAFMRMLGLAYTQSQRHLRDYMAEHYGGSFDRFARLLSDALPDATQEDLFWSIHFALGSAVFTLSNLATLRAMSENDTGRKTKVDAMVLRLTQFMAAGLDGVGRAGKPIR